MLHRCNIFIIDDNVIDILGSINEATVVTAPKHPVNIIIGVIRKRLHILHFDTIILLSSLFENINHVIVKKNNAMCKYSYRSKKCNILDGTKKVHRNKCYYPRIPHMVSK